MKLHNFHVIVTSLQDVVSFRPGRIKKKKNSSVNEWLTNIIKKLFNYIFLQQPVAFLGFGKYISL